MSRVVSRPSVPLLVFTFGYIAVAALLAFLGGNPEFVFYIVIMLVLVAAVGAAHAAVGFSPGVLWCLSAWGFLHMAGGLVPVAPGLPVDGPQPVLYSLWLVPRILKYDQLTHAYGFGITTWLCWQALARGLAAGSARPLRPTAGLLVLCAAAGMGFGALNEVIEFIATLTLEETNVGGYANTGWDLVANLCGCVLAAVLIGWFARR